MKHFAAATLAALLLAPAWGQQKIGTEMLERSDFCMYSDCAARHAWAAHEMGWGNPANLAAIFDFMTVGAAAGGGYFGFSVGGIKGGIASGTFTLAFRPFVLQVNVADAAADGDLRSIRGTDLNFRTRRVRLSGGMDVGKLVPGLSVGFIGVPYARSRFGLGVPALGLGVLQADEEVGYDLTAGVSWRGGEGNWGRLGAVLNVVENDLTTVGLDLATGEPYRERGEDHAWFGRVGASARPFVPLGLASVDTELSRYLALVSVSADIAVRNLTVPHERARQREVVYAGFDLPVLPDGWNPLAAYIRPWGIAGGGTDGSWGVGLGLYGVGALQPVSCDVSTTSAPGTASLGGRFNMTNVACTLAVGF